MALHGGPVTHRAEAREHGVEPEADAEKEHQAAGETQLREGQLVARGQPGAAAEQPREAPEPPAGSLGRLLAQRPGEAREPIVRVGRHRARVCHRRRSVASELPSWEAAGRPTIWSGSEFREAEEKGRPTSWSGPRFTSIGRLTEAKEIGPTVQLAAGRGPSSGAWPARRTHSTVLRAGMWYHEAA